MKHVILFSIFFLAQHYIVFGQYTATNVLYAQYSQLKQTNLLISTMETAKYGRRVHIGEGLMIAGGALITVSAVGIATNQQADEGDASRQILFALIGVGGLSVFIPGVITFAYGLRADRRSKFSIVNKRNQLGVAYNF